VEHVIMKIAVCVKQVVSREWQLRVDESKAWIRDQDASYELNEPDAYALEEALRLKERHGGEVVVCSAGPARVSQVVREALARGARSSSRTTGSSAPTPSRRPRPWPPRSRTSRAT
jgi:electron transfer flavoprotein alpha/beta subunit